MSIVRPSRATATFFATPREFRAWLARHHARSGQLWVGYLRRATGRPSLTWPESVDEALCFGWIDGLRVRLDEESYAIRFTPRREGSHWSAVNVRRMAALFVEGRVAPAGAAAFAARREENTARASYERGGDPVLDPAQQARLEADATAWRDFAGRSASYRRAAIHWVSSARLATTRERRFLTLLDCSARGEPIPPLRWARGAGRRR